MLALGARWQNISLRNVSWHFPTHPEQLEVQPTGLPQRIFVGGWRSVAVRFDQWRATQTVPTRPESLEWPVFLSFQARTIRVRDYIAIGRDQSFEFRHDKRTVTWLLRIGLQLEVNQPSNLHVLA